MDRRSHDDFSPKNAPDKNKNKSRGNPHYGDYLCPSENQFMGGGDPRFYSGLVGAPYQLQGGGYGGIRSCGMRSSNMLNHDILNQNMAGQNYPANYATSLANNQNYGHQSSDMNFDPSLMGKDAARDYYNANAKMSHANKNLRNYAMNPELLCQGNTFPPMSGEQFKEMYRNQELTFRNAVADINKFQKSNPQLNMYHQNMTQKMGMFHHQHGQPTSETEGAANAALYNNYNNMMEECTTYLNNIFDTHSIDLFVRSASGGAQNLDKSDPKMATTDPSSSPDDEPSLLMSDGDDSPMQNHHTNSSPMTSFDSSGLSKLEQDPFSPSTTTSIPSIPSITSIDSGIVVNFPISSPFSIPPYSNEGAAMSDSFISPQRPNDLISPAQLMTSPAQLTSSSAQLTTSPAHMMTSPAQTMPSPAQLMASPAQPVPSPAQPEPSPAQLLPSPEGLNDSFSDPAMLDCLVSPSTGSACMEANNRNCPTQVVGNGAECFAASDVPHMNTYNQEQSVGYSCVSDGNVPCPDQLYFHSESSSSCEGRFNPNNATDLSPSMGALMPHPDPWAIEKSLNSRLDQQQPFIRHNYDCAPKKRGAPRKYPHPGRPPGSGNKNHSNLRTVIQGETRCEINPLTGEIRQKRKYVKTGKHSKKYKALMMMASNSCGGPNPEFGPITNRFSGPMDPYGTPFACPMGPNATNFAGPQCSAGLQSPYFSEAPSSMVSNVVHADVKPKVVHADVKPKVVYPEVKPKIVHAEVKPKVVYPDVKPKVVYPDVKPKVVHAEIKPKVVNAEVKAKLVHAEFKPKVVHTEFKPKVALAEVKSKVAFSEAKSKVALAEVKPKVVHTEVKPKVFLAEAKTKVVHTEVKTKVVHTEVKSKVVHTEVKTKVVHTEVKSKVVNAVVKPQIRLPRTDIFEVGKPKNVKEIVKAVKVDEIKEGSSGKVAESPAENKEVKVTPEVKVKAKADEVCETSPAEIESEIMETEVPPQDDIPEVEKDSGILDEVEDMDTKETSDIDELVDEQEEKPRKRKYEKSGKHRKKKFCSSVMYRTEISSGLKMKFSLAAALPESDAPKRRRRKRRKVVEEEGEEEGYDKDQGEWGKTLPEVVLKKIFKVVTDSEGCIPFLVRASQVCKLWRKVALEPCLWNNIDLSSAWVSKNPILNDHNFRWLCENRLARVKDLNLGSLLVAYYIMTGVVDHILLITQDLVRSRKLRIVFISNFADGGPLWYRVHNGRLSFQEAFLKNTLYKQLNGVLEISNYFRTVPSVNLIFWIN